MASTSERVVALALYRVVFRSMAAGRSLSYEQLLEELAVEVVEDLDWRDARLRRRVRRRVLDAQVRLAAAAESRAAVDADGDLAAFDMAPPGVPDWHPEHHDRDVI